MKSSVQIRTIKSSRAKDDSARQARASKRQNTMTPIPNGLAPLLAAVPAWLLPLSGLLISLVLIFAGRTVVKVLAFLIVGLAGALLGATLASQYLPPGGLLVGALLGLVLGGLLGAVAVEIGVGLAIGYGAYVLALDFAGEATALIAGIAFFMVGLALSNKILGAVTAVAGGFLLFDVLLSFDLAPTLATTVAALATMAGIWVQEDLGRKMSQPTATNVGGQPSDRR